MPGPKKAQRTKGNLKPSSSSQAAQLLAASGQASTGFIGFSNQPAFVPASEKFDDVDSILDGDFRLVLRKFSKRDTTTKIKALQEFTSLCHSKDEECVKMVVPFWPRIYNKLAIDVDHKVRELSQKALATLASHAGKKLAPQLKSMMGIWMVGMCDTYPTVASAANTAFSSTFPFAKQKEAIRFCKLEIADCLAKNILKHTAQTLSDPLTTSEEDMESKYQRVVASSLHALRKLMFSLQEDTAVLAKHLNELLGSPSFWKHAKSSVPIIKGGALSFLSALCQISPTVSGNFLNKIAPLVFLNLDTEDPTFVSYAWEAVLSLVNAHQNCWEHVNWQKAVWPKVKDVLEGACRGLAAIIAPCLLPLLSKMPNVNFTLFFDAFRLGLSDDNALKSPSDLSAMVKAFLECIQYVLKLSPSSTDVTSLVQDQVLVVVQASFTHPKAVLSRTPLYASLMPLLSSLESSVEQEFWVELSSYTRSLLLVEYNQVKNKFQGSKDLEEGREDASHLTHRLARFVHGFVYQEVSQTSSRKSRVTFGQKESLSNSHVANPLREKSKQKLSAAAETFICDLEVSAFCLANLPGIDGDSVFLSLFRELVTVHIPQKAATRLLKETDPLCVFVFEELGIQYKKRERGTDLSPDKLMDDPYGQFVQATLLDLLVLEQKSLEGRGLRKAQELALVLFAFIAYLKQDDGSLLLRTVLDQVQEPRMTCLLIQNLLQQARAMPACLCVVHESLLCDKIEELSKSVMQKGAVDGADHDLENAVWEMLASVLATTGDTDDQLLPSSCVEAVMSISVSSLQNLGPQDMVQRSDTVLLLLGMIKTLLEKHKVWSHSHLREMLHHMLQLLLESEPDTEDDVVGELESVWVMALTAGLFGMEGSALLHRLCEVLARWSSTQLLDNHRLERASRMVHLITSSVLWAGEMSVSAEAEDDGDEKEDSGQSKQFGEEEQDEGDEDVEALPQCSLTRQEVTDALLVSSTGAIADSDQLQEFLYMSGQALTLSVDSHKPSATASTDVFCMTALYNLKVLENQLSGRRGQKPRSWHQGRKDGVPCPWSAHQLQCLSGLTSSLFLLVTAGENHLQMSEELRENIQQLQAGLMSCLRTLNREELMSMCIPYFSRSKGRGDQLGLQGLAYCVQVLKGAEKAEAATLSSDDADSVWKAIRASFLQRCFDCEDTAREVESLMTSIDGRGSELVEAFALATTLLMSGQEGNETLVIDVCECLSGFLSLASGVPELSPEDRTSLFLQTQLLMNWLKENGVALLTASDTVIPSTDIMTLNSWVARFLKLVAVPQREAFWEFSLCHQLEWIQFLSEAGLCLDSPVHLKSLASAVCQLTHHAAKTFIEAPVVTEVSPESPADFVTEKSKTEWNEFFSDGIYSPLLPMFVSVATASLETPPWGANSLLLQSLSLAVSLCPHGQILSHQLTPRLTLSDSCACPDSFKTLLNHLAPLLVHRHRSVRLAAYRILHSIIDEIPQYEAKHDDEQQQRQQDEKEEELEVRSPPEALVAVVGSGQAPLELLLLVELEESVELEPGTEDYGLATGYLLAWLLLLDLFTAAPNQLRAQYASFFKGHNCVDQLLERLFRLMPARPPPSLLESDPLLHTDVPEQSRDLAGLAVTVFRCCLETIPALVRTWWLDQDRRPAGFIDRFTSQYLSSSLCLKQLSSAQKSHNSIEDMTIRTRPAAREVIAVCEMAEVKVNMTITLPENYPLGKLEVSCDKRVGVSQTQWDRWLLQLNIFLQHQNGSIVDGLRVWKGNMDKRFEGIDDCMICFSVIHGTTFQLPRLTCRTCRKKFHSACLYKWFSTSQKSSCPLCRELF